MFAVVRVTEVEPLRPRTLRVRFDDGMSRNVDCSFLFHGPLGEPLNDPEYFRLVKVDHEAGTIVWPNGLDPAPALLHGDNGGSGLPPDAANKPRAA